MTLAAPNGAASTYRGCARSERECALTGGGGEYVSISCGVPLAALFGPVQETGTIMGEPSVLDAVDQRPRHIIGGQGRVVDWPMDCACVGLAGARGAECQHAASAGRLLSADRVHDGAGLQRGEISGGLSVMPGVGEAESYGAGNVFWRGVLPCVEQGTPLPGTDKIHRMPPLAGAGIVDATGIGCTVSVQREAQGSFHMLHKGMGGEQRMHQANAAGAVSLGRADLDRKPKQPGEKIPWI